MSVLSPRRDERVAAPGHDDRRRRLQWAVGLGLLFLALAVVMTFPNVSRLRSYTPGDYGDPMFSQWLLRWEVHALFTDPFSLFDPNIYWPVPDTLVYSDPSLAAAPFAAVYGFLFGWPMAYNLIYLSGWVASLACTYALAHRLTGSRPGSVLGALVFTFAGVRLGHYGHFPMLSTFLVPLSLWLLLRFLEERRWWQASALGAAMSATVMNAGYVAVVLFPALAVVGGGWLIAERFRPGARFVTGLALTGAVFLVLSFPVLHKYRLQGDFLRRDYVHETATVPRDFIAPAERSWMYGWLEDWGKVAFEHRLFLGVVAPTLAVVGGLALVQARRRRPDAPDAPDEDAPPPVPDLRRRGLLLVILAGLPALILAFGKYQTVFGVDVKLPFSLVADLPGFRSVRAFGRFTVVPLAGLAVLAAAGYERLLRSRPARMRVLAATVLGAAMLAEYRVQIVGSRRIDSPENAAVNHALTRLPEGPVLELPVGDTHNVSWGYTEPPRMLLSAIDWFPRVNGYSGYTPDGYPENEDLLNTLDDGGPARPEALALLDKLGVRYIVIRTAALDRDLEGAGVLYADRAGADNILAALPPDRVERITREGNAFLVILRSRPPGP